MTDWMTNRVSVTGNILDVDLLVKKCISTDQNSEIFFDFGKIVEVPAHLDDEDLSAWSSENWGTRWNAQSYKEEMRYDGYWAFLIDTPGTAPIPIFEAIARQFPSLELEVCGINENWDHSYTGSSENGGFEFECDSATNDAYCDVFGSY